MECIGHHQAHFRVHERPKVGAQGDYFLELPLPQHCGIPLKTPMSLEIHLLNSFFRMPSQVGSPATTVNAQTPKRASQTGTSPSVNRPKQCKDQERKACSRNLLGDLRGDLPSELPSELPSDSPSVLLAFTSKFGLSAPITRKPC